MMVRWFWRPLWHFAHRRHWSYRMWNFPMWRRAWGRICVWGMGHDPEVPF
jgi:hypothetical protein